MGEPPAYLRAMNGGARLQVKVVPRSSTTGIAGALGDRLKIKITAPPVDSAANDELVKFLARRLGLGRSAVRITHGQTARNKTIELLGIDALTAAAALV